MAFTEFCCRSGGSNLNAGTRTGNSTVPGTAADLTYASGNWVQSTRVFTVASGDPVADGVAVGDYVSIYADGSTVTGYVAQVTARTTTTITTSSTVKAGTAPTDGTGSRTLRVGGAWQGMNAASGVPFTLATIADLNSTGTTVRINMRNDSTFSITANVTVTGSSSNVNGLVIQGFTTSYGDGGKFTLDGGTSGATYTLLTCNGNGIGTLVVDAILQNNGATGSGSFLGIGASWFRCIGRNCRASGLSGSIGHSLTECEVYNFNQSGAGTGYGIFGTGAINCFVHDASGANNVAFAPQSTSGFGAFINCIATKCAVGFSFAGSSSSPSWSVINCDVYDMTGNGIESSSTSGRTVSIINCNILKCGGWGINLHVGSAGGKHNGNVLNCGFGSGTMANTSGNINTNSVNESGTVTYAANSTPWTAPATGDFRINLAAAKNTGYGSWCQLGSLTGTIGYPDIGAAQAVGGGGGMRMVNIRGGADQ